jgi:hypothetical protein
MSKEQLIKETEAILKLVEKDSRIGNYLEEIKKLLEDLNDKL